MKTRKLFYSLFIGLSLMAAKESLAQGLLRLTQSDSDYEQNQPLTWSLSLSSGFDSIKYADANLSNYNYDSQFIKAGLGLTYASAGPQTQWSIGLDLGATRYFEGDWRGDDLFYNARLGVEFSHRFNPRLSLTNSFFVAYEIEPDYTSGFSSGRRLGQYFYATESINVAYAWSERISTSTGYSFSGITYVENDDEFYGGQDDRFTHTFSQNVRYKFNRRTSALLEYRYSITDYDREVLPGSYDPNYNNHYLLVGVDHAWSNRSNVSVRVGAEWYQSDNSDSVNPYLEATLNLKVGRRSSLTMFGFVGSDGSDLGLYDARRSYRVGMNGNHQFTEKFSMNAGLSYALGDYTGNELVNDVSEHQITASLGFNYNFYRNLSLQGSYSYSTIMSEESFREYDRHRVDLGLNATF